ncbi:hypothetical protein V8E55_010335, partial [Tylopilus felleus]
PPFEPPPHLRFVECSRADTRIYKVSNKYGKSNTGSLSPVCLAEEVIPRVDKEGTHSFTKFIHNADAAPKELNDLTSNEMTEFLSFMQH